MQAWNKINLSLNFNFNQFNFINFSPIYQSEYFPLLIAFSEMAQCVQVSGAVPVPTPVQFVLYTNDAVDVSYVDGSHLQLSPCGATFVHSGAPAAGRHPLAGLIDFDKKGPSLHAGKLFLRL